MLTYPKSRLVLNKGHTYAEYILRCNAASTPYAELCAHLRMTLSEARDTYDKVYNLPLSQIGQIKRGLRAAVPATPNLQCLKTGTDWRAR